MQKTMKRTYIAPLTRKVSVETSQFIAESFDAKYGYEDENFFGDHGGGEWESYTPSGTINWRGGDDPIDADDMYARGFSFGSFWE